MNITVIPGKALKGEIAVPGDKSISHRAALLAAMADGDSIIRNFLFAGVTDVMLKALADLGVSYEMDGSTLTIHGRGISALKAPVKPIDCGNSATTLRLLAGFLAAAGIPAVLDGSPGLRRRPMKRIIEPLTAMGVSIQATAEGTAPLVLGKREPDERLRPIDYATPVASAQVKTAILFASLAAGGPCTIHEPGPSRDHTERLMSSLGIRVRKDNSGGAIYLDPPQLLEIRPFSIDVPGDLSSAAFLITGALIAPGSEIKIPDVGINPTRSGLIDALQGMGADIRISEPVIVHGEPVGDIRAEFSHLRGIKIEGPLVVRMIDEFPALAVASAYADGITSVCDAIELRYKESDRIASLVSELRNLGGKIDENQDGFVVYGSGRMAGGKVAAHRDHRLAMALAIAGLATERPVTIQGAEIISESFPGFFEALARLGASLVDVAI